MTFNIKIWCIWTDKRWKSRGFGPRKASELGRLFIYNLTKLTDKKNMVSSQHPNHQKVPKAFRKMHVFVGKNSDFSVFTYQNCLSTKKIIPPRPAHPVTPNCKSSNGSCQWHIHFRLGRSAQTFDGGFLVENVCICHCWGNLFWGIWLHNSRWSFVSKLSFAKMSMVQLLKCVCMRSSVTCLWGVFPSFSKCICISILLHLLSNIYYNHNPSDPCLVYLTVPTFDLVDFYI